MAIPAQPGNPIEYGGWQSPAETTLLKGTALQRFDQLGDLAAELLGPWPDNPLLFGSQLNVGEFGTVNVTALYGISRLAVATSANDPSIQRGSLLSITAEYFNPDLSNWPNSDDIDSSSQVIRPTIPQRSVEPVEIKIVEVMSRHTLTNKRSLTRPFLATLGECVFAHNEVDYWEQVVRTGGDHALEYLSQLA